MDWLKKKKKEEEKQRLVQVRERGALLLEDLIECCNGKCNPIKFFSADEIIKATNNFNESNVIPHVGYFTYILYSGKIDNRPMIFVRNYFYSYHRRHYCRDIAISSMVSGHKNFLKLLGCCLELEEPIIVYNSVEEFSFLDLEMVVSWKKRIKIAEDIATVLAYLHTAFPRPFVYRKMGLASIFLDEDGVARLWDFSFCISIPEGETSVAVDTLEGGSEFAEDDYLYGTVSEKTDVYAIGILMQKLVLGQKMQIKLGYEHQDDSGGDGDGYETSRTTFGRWLLKYKEEEERIDEIIDPNMLEKMDHVGEEELCQMKAVLMLSLRCTGRTNWEIPNMVEVAKELKSIQISSFPSSSSSSAGGTIIIDYIQEVSFSSSCSSSSSLPADETIL